MDLKKHNPDYKLISVFINGKELVYGESNTGDNPGLEIYHYKTPYKVGDHFYYSRRYTADKIPGIYSFLYRHLKNLIPYCPAGHKLSLDRVEYHDIANLQGRYKQGV
jgi:hypothetical protein